MVCLVMIGFVVVSCGKVSQARYNMLGYVMNMVEQGEAGSVRCVETRSATFRNVALRQVRWVTLNFVELGSVVVR